MNLALGFIRMCLIRLSVESNFTISLIVELPAKEFLVSEGSRGVRIINSSKFGKFN